MYLLCALFGENYIQFEQMQSCQPHDMQPREIYQKNAWDGGLQAWDMLMEIKYCGSSTVTNNKQTLLRPDSVPYNGACKCFAREIEVIMRVRVRLCGNACVSRRMRVSWQLCKWFKCYGGKNFKQKICKLYLKSFRTTSACKYNLPYKALPPSRNHCKRNWERLSSPRSCCITSYS